MRQFVTFRLGEQLFGLEILLVKEINHLLSCDQVPHAPKHIMGLVNLRGQIITVIDLGVRILGTSCNQTEHTRNIILKSTHELETIGSRLGRDDLETCVDMVGLRVDAIGEVIEVDESDQSSIPANIPQVEEKFLQSTVMLENELLLILRTNEILRNEHLVDSPIEEGKTEAARRQEP